MNALMFHDVVAAGDEDRSGFPGRDAALYKVTPERFEEQIRRDRHALPPDHRPAITFDDGGVSAMLAADVLEQHGLTGCFFITVNFIGTRGICQRARHQGAAGREATSSAATRALIRYDSGIARRRACSTSGRAAAPR